MAKYSLKPVINPVLLEGIAKEVLVWQKDRERKPAIVMGFFFFFSLVFYDFYDF